MAFLLSYIEPWQMEFGSSVTTRILVNYDYLLQFSHHDPVQNPQLFHRS